MIVISYLFSCHGEARMNMADLEPQAQTLLFIDLWLQLMATTTRRSLPQTDINIYRFLMMVTVCSKEVTASLQLRLLPSPKQHTVY